MRYISLACALPACPTNSYHVAVQEAVRTERNRRVLPVAVRLSEGPLTEPTAGAQPRPPELVFMPQRSQPRFVGSREYTAGRRYARALHARKPVTGPVQTPR